MKIIDLLSKIANGEEVPKIIKYQTNILKFNGSTYIDADGDSITDWIFSDLSNINCKVEIIEEEKDIEELPPYVSDANLLKEVTMNRNKINEIVRKLKDKE